MTRSFFVEASAVVDVEAATAHYLGEGGVALADRFRVVVLDAFKLIAQSPGVGASDGYGARSIPVGARFPYRVVYDLTPTAVIVLAVIHAARGPVARRVVVSRGRKRGR